MRELTYGKVFRARVLKKTKHHIYKLLSTIVDEGELLGRDCLISHMGHPDSMTDLIGRNFVVKLGYSKDYERCELRMREKTLIGFPITFNIPFDFKPLGYQDAVFWGTWDESLRRREDGERNKSLLYSWTDSDSRSHTIPDIRDVLAVYNLGVVPEILFSCLGLEGKVLSFEVSHRSKPKKISRSEGKPRSLVSSLYRYSRKMNRNQLLGSPKMLVLDDSVVRDRDINYDFEKIGERGFILIGMDRQWEPNNS